ncbi:MAG: PilN domain-containing protein [Candidatus Competibacteraceae bacterium]|jgi:type IV pilus assembly protein PilN|nr:PilN domain-containing protein [Candidatus Competibacteraceae bacterium]
MTRINLLPWRDARRISKQRNTLVLFAITVVFAGVGVFGAYLYVEQLIANQEARNQYLQGEIERLKKAEQEIKALDETKARLLGRLQVIQDLQARRPGVVRALDSLVRLLPEDIYLSSMDVAGNTWTLRGTASSNNVVSDFMRRLAESPWFGEPTLKLIENEDVGEIRTSAFELSVSRTAPKSGSDSGGQS